MRKEAKCGGACGVRRRVRVKYGLCLCRSPPRRKGGFSSLISLCEFPKGKREEKDGRVRAGGRGRGRGRVQEDLFFTAGGVECLGREREEGFDAHGCFEWEEVLGSVRGRGDFLDGGGC